MSSDLRADYLARAHGIVDATTAGYLYVENAPFGGTFVLMEASAVTRVVRVAKISEQAARSLATAADGSADAARVVDDVLRRILVPSRP